MDDLDLPGRHQQNGERRRLLLHLPGGGEVTANASQIQGRVGDKTFLMQRQ